VRTSADARIFHFLRCNIARLDAACQRTQHAAPRRSSIQIFIAAIFVTIKNAEDLTA